MKRREEEKWEKSCIASKIRTIPHTSGNWATFIFIKLDIDLEIISMIKNIYPELEQIPMVHLSLSKTVYIREFQIEPLRQFLEGKLRNQMTFNISIKGIGQYWNEEKTRWFVSLDILPNEELTKVLSIINQTMKSFGLVKFYENPKFHASILWSIKEYDLNFPLINSILNDYIKQPIRIEEIIMKSGHLESKFSLAN